MKNKFSIILIIILSSLSIFFIPSQKALASDLTAKQQQAFIDAIKDEAINGYKQYNILPSLTIAQAILESSWGQSSLTIQGNNLFGIKAYSDWSGAYIEIPTREYFSSGYVIINAKFKAYQSYTDSIKDHNTLLSTDNYEKVRKATDYSDACYAIYDCGYATSPKYSEMLIEIIDYYKLYNYDNLAKQAVVQAVQTEMNSKKNNPLDNPIIKSAKNMIFPMKPIFTYNAGDKTSEERDSSSDIEDTNNIPSELGQPSNPNYNYWYVIYCLLQKYYPDMMY